MWNSFYSYLLIDVKVKDTSKNIWSIKSRFNKIEKYFQDKEFTRDNFNQFILELKNEGRMPATLNNIIKIGKHYDKFLKINCIQDYTFYKEIPPKKEELTAKEVKQLAEVDYPYTRLASERNFRDYIVINFLFDTGCRIGELQNLLWENVSNAPVPNITFMDTKTDVSRRVNISEELYTLLHQLPKYGNRVFDSRGGKIFNYQQFNFMIKKRAEIAGIDKHVSCHIFRYSCITYLLNVVHAKTEHVMKHVGHKKYDTTARYNLVHLQEMSYLAASSPFSVNAMPKNIRGEMMREYAVHLLNKNDEYIELSYLKNGGTRIDILPMPK